MRTIRLPMMFLAVWLPETHSHGAVTCVSSDSVHIFVSISFFLLLPISTFVCNVRLSRYPPPRNAIDSDEMPWGGKVNLFFVDVPRDV